MTTPGETPLPPYTPELGKWCEHLRRLECLRKSHYIYAKRWRDENPGAAPLVFA